jgi:hypothetical protein
MTERFDDGGVAVAVDTVWRQLRPALERHYAEPAALLRPSQRGSRRRRAARAAGLGLALAVVGTGGAVAARALLGDPAPPSVQASIAAVDEGMPADLRLQPDVENARSVARDGDAVLYAADLPDGGTCTELAVGGQPAGAICVRGEDAAPIQASIPGTPEDTGLPVVVGGRVNVVADRAVAVVDGSQRVPVLLEPGGYYVLSLDSAASAAARRGLSLEALRGDAVVASVDLSDAFTAERPMAEPLSLELVSADGDLTRVVSVYGTATVPGTATVRLVFPDGTATEVAVGPDGRYELTLPDDRQADLADRPGRVVALDSDGHELASRAVAAVSWWRAHEGESAGR